MALNRKKIVKYFVPILMFLVAAFQLFQVNNDGLTRWKGGGYGMYSEIHYSYYEVWITYQGEIKEIKHDEKIEGISSRRSRRLILKVKSFPNNRNLRALAKILKKDEGYPITIQVWKPKINIDNLSYSRVLLKEITE